MSGTAYVCRCGTLLDDVGYCPGCGGWAYRIEDEAAFRLLGKFHRETGCGRGGMHWAECEAFVCEHGWESWEAWRETILK
jgi:hypothetical protein